MDAKCYDADLGGSIWQCRKTRIKQLATAKRRKLAEERNRADGELDDQEELEKWLTKMAALEDDNGGDDDENEEDNTEKQTFEDSDCDQDDLGGAAQKGLLACGKTFSCGR